MTAAGEAPPLYTMKPPVPELVVLLIATDVAACELTSVCPFMYDRKIFNGVVAPFAFTT
jgi:hypothetical protein